jgi:hypothetical protein
MRRRGAARRPGRCVFHTPGGILEALITRAQSLLANPRWASRCRWPVRACSPRAFIARAMGSIIIGINPFRPSRARRRRSGTNPAAVAADELGKTPEADHLAAVKRGKIEA